MEEWTCYGYKWPRESDLSRGEGWSFLTPRREFLYVLGRIPGPNEPQKSLPWLKETRGMKLIKLTYWGRCMIRMCYTTKLYVSRMTYNSKVRNLKPWVWAHFPHGRLIVQQSPAIQLSKLDDSGLPHCSLNWMAVSCYLIIVLYDSSILSNSPTKMDVLREFKIKEIIKAYGKIWGASIYAT